MIIIMMPINITVIITIIKIIAITIIITILITIIVITFNTADAIEAFSIQCARKSPIVGHFVGHFPTLDVGHFPASQSATKSVTPRAGGCCCAVVPQWNMDLISHPSVENQKTPTTIIATT